MIYGLCPMLQEKEVKYYCFDKCQKVILGILTDDEWGHFWPCREKKCPHEETNTGIIGDVDGEEFCIRKLQPIGEVLK